MNPYEPPKTENRTAVAPPQRRYPIPTVAGFATVAMVICGQVAYSLGSAKAAWLSGVFAVIAFISFLHRR